MQKNLILICAVATALFQSCGDGYKHTDDGLAYQLHTENEGARIQEGDYVSMDMIYSFHSDSLDKDSVLFNTYEQGRKVELMVMKPQFKADIISALNLCTAGDSISFQLNADSLFEKTFNAPRPPFIPAGSPITFHLKIDKVTPRADLKKELERAQAEQIGKEKQIVEKYIADKKLSTTSTADGLHYIIKKQGNGDKPMPGDTVVVKYTGKLLDGTVFDSSEGREAIRFPIGQGQVIRGWEEALALFNKGTSATLIIPSHLGYGPNGAGNGVIPSNATLVFDVQLVDIVKK